MNTRGWKFIDENKEISEEEYERIRVRADILARKWSELHNAEEAERFSYSDEDRRERYDAYLSPMDEQEYEATIYWKEVQDDLTRRARETQYKIIHEELTRLGVRMMRPYEHWNEEERYMQYMEEGRFGHWSN